MTSHESSPDKIYVGGDIITMNDQNPTAEAVAVKDGKIHAVGTRVDLLKMIGESTEVIDLEGKTLLPGFIDGHSHFFQAAMIANYANVSPPPVGSAASIADIIAVLKDHVTRNPLKPGDWLVGYGYDGSVLKDGREATRDDFDVDFPDTPLLLVHVSGHGGVLNSAAFRKVGIDANTPTPPGALQFASQEATNPPAC